MPMNKYGAVAAAAVATLAFAAGIYLRAVHRSAETAAVSTLTRMAFPSLNGSAVSLEQWRGKVVVVNFWASWCAPCREEIPGLLNVQQKYAAKGLQVVGIAVDTLDNSKSAAGAMGINYPVLIGGIGSVDLTRELGNKTGALPYTIILDRDGALIRSHLGLLRQSQLEDMLRPLLG
jgi:thiol-disulfide isomerase/thioredoxin